MQRWLNALEREELRCRKPLGHIGVVPGSLDGEVWDRGAAWVQEVRVRGIGDWAGILRDVSFQENAIPALNARKG